MKKSLPLYLVVISLILSTNIYGQHDQEINKLEKNKKDIIINIQQYRQTLVSAPKEINQSITKSSPISIDIELPSGIHNLKVVESPIMEPQLAAQYPEIKNYLVSNSDGSVKGRINVSPSGISAVLHTEKGLAFVEPKKNASLGEHITYYGSDEELREMTCDVVENAHIQNDLQNSSLRTTGNGATLKIYRIAIASAGEFTQEFGPGLMDVNTKINEYLTALNALYESELSFRFVLIASNDDIIFSDPATDGLDPASRTTSAQNVINATIGAANYDIGHVFYTIEPVSGCSGCSATSGVAGLGVVCNNSQKGRGWTGATGNASLSLFMGTFAHEIGHQFSAHHSYYGTTNNCNQRSAGHGYEPGSGNTLMSYEGTCGAQNINPRVSTQYFHIHSLEEMISFASGISCNTTASTGNTPPVVTAPTDFTIPIGTPFTLMGTGTDADTDPLTYVWEQYDTDNLSLSSPNGAPNDAAISTTAPLFRSFDPSTGGNERTFPKLSDILGGTQTQGEILPQVGRTMHFRLTARDNQNTGIGGGIHCDEVEVTVDAAMGPFAVTSQNSSPTYIYDGSNEFEITWSENNTAASCPNVDILMSTDGGATFPITLATATANDGTESFTVPNNITTTARIKIICSTNVFFDINDTDITITNGCPADVDGYSFTPTTSPITETSGNTALNLSLMPDYKIPVTTKAFTVTTNDPTMRLTYEDGGACSAPFSNSPHYTSFEFTVDVAGVYTFARTGSASTLNLYTPSFDDNNTCTNWLGSNVVYTGSFTTNPSFTETLSTGVTYILTICDFSTGDTGSANITFSGPGNVLEEVLPPSTFVYTYVAVDNSGNIVQFDANSDFTDLAAGTYTIHGLSYYEAEDLSSYVGGTYSSFITDLPGTICGDPSSNSITLTVTGCTTPSVIPLTGAGYTATDQCTDAMGWTHYWDDVNGTDGDADDVLLLSVKKNGNNIGDVGDGTFSLELDASSGAGVSQITAPYVVNSNDWWVFNRHWVLTPTTEPTSDVNVRFYYTSTDLTDLQAQIPGVTHTDLYFWKINDIVTTYNNNPTAGHSGIPYATAYNTDGYWQYSNGSASTSNWAYTANALGNANYHQAEYIVGHFGGGGGGASSAGDGALPVELLSFTGKSTRDYIRLNWSTATETNSSHFVVERSYNSIDFVRIGEVKAQGESTLEKNYFLDDLAPKVGVNYYRLIQIDLDGKETIYGPIPVDFEQQGIISIFPIPVKGEFNIRYHANKSGEIYWEIFNANGQIISNNNEAVISGNNMLTIKENNLSNGLHYIKITQDNYVGTMKFVVSK